MFEFFTLPMTVLAPRKFNKYLFSVYSVLDTVLSVEDIAIKDKISIFMELKL